MMKTATNETIGTLYAAVNQYVQDNGGKLFAIGGVQVQQMADGTFYVAVKCAGELPEFVQESNQQTRNRIGARN
jgi:hypothetical protein